MQFDPNNAIVKLCAQGMEKEGEGKTQEASALFLQAWKEAQTNQEKCIAAHYVARHQKTTNEKLNWDQIALNSALSSNDPAVQGMFPSLYLNVAKGYEDLNNLEKAKEQYQLALSYSDFLAEDGYGQMIKGGILNGIDRVESGKQANK